MTHEKNIIHSDIKPDNILISNIDSQDFARYYMNKKIFSKYQI